MLLLYIYFLCANINGVHCTHNNLTLMDHRVLFTHPCDCMCVDCVTTVEWRKKTKNTRMIPLFRFCQISSINAWMHMCGVFFLLIRYCSEAIVLVFICVFVWWNLNEWNPHSFNKGYVFIKSIVCSFELADYESMSIPTTMAKLKFPLFFRSQLKNLEWAVARNTYRCFSIKLKWYGFRSQFAFHGNGREKLWDYFMYAVCHQKPNIWSGHQSTSNGYFFKLQKY